MFFSKRHAAQVEKLRSPQMGTDTLAPLLYCLARYTRSRTVLEAGAGYTTPFLAQALADNQRAFENEAALLRRKTERYVAGLDALAGSSTSRTADSDSTAAGLAAIYGPKVSPLAHGRFEWLSAEPSWLRPSYYMQPFEPQLFCIDQLRPSDSRAHDVPSVINAIGLKGVVTFDHGDFWSFDPACLPAQHRTIDLMWVDVATGARNLIELLQGRLWQSLRADGGLLVIHDMLTTRGGQFLVDEVKRRQRARVADFETVGLLEPHRLMQGDFIMIRKTSAGRAAPIDDLIHHADADVLEDEAKAFVARGRDDAAAGQDSYETEQRPE